MPYFGYKPNCPRCGHRVYHAEQVIAVDRSWHKACFKCANCRSSLDSRTWTEHKRDVFCKQCHNRLFGTKGYGYGVGAGILNMDTGHPAKASEVIPKQAQKSQSVVSCRKSFELCLASSANSVHGSKWKNPMFSDLCGRCGKKTYAAERVLAAGTAWHRFTCFKCCACNRHLGSCGVAEHHNSIYCKTCYGRIFAVNGYGYGFGAGCLSLDKDLDLYSSKPQVTIKRSKPPRHFLASRKHLFRSQDDLSSKCYRCAGTVYAAEKVFAAGHVWHKRCFTCLTCSRNLETTILAERNGDIYCNACYSRQFGPKGFRNGLVLTPR